ATTADGQVHAFLYSDGTMTDLGVGIAYAINDSGQVVGAANFAGQRHAFLYSDGTMTDLDSLLVDQPGITLSFAHGINDQGQIIAGGFLLPPAPAPPGLALAGVGALCLAGCAWRRRHRAA